MGDLLVLDLSSGQGNLEAVLSILHTLLTFRQVETTSVHSPIYIRRYHSEISTQLRRQYAGEGTPKSKGDDCIWSMHQYKHTVSHAQCCSTKESTVDLSSQAQLSEPTGVYGPVNLQGTGRTCNLADPMKNTGPICLYTVAMSTPMAVHRRPLQALKPHSQTAHHGVCNHRLHTHHLHSCACVVKPGVHTEVKTTMCSLWYVIRVTCPMLIQQSTHVMLP